ncbi:MAG: four helix bundle protein [Planctomycetota bacterium]|jgi:four helix bundle protein
MKDFRELQVWHKAHKLALEVYKVSAAFPKEEIYSLTNQVRRAAVSIVTNIAEGCGRGSKKKLKQFLQISTGSASEVEYQILLSHELGYMDSKAYESINSGVQEVKKMLSSYIVKIN